MESYIVNFRKRTKSRIQEEYDLVIILACAVLVGLAAFFYHYRIPVPFDSEIMAAELYKAVPVTENGLTQWINIDHLKFEQTKKVIEDDSRVIDRIQLALTEQIACDGVQTYTRTIDRNEKPVRVTYYCYTQKPWNLLLGGHRGRKIITDGDLYGDSNNSINYVKMKREIYYLPEGNIKKLSRLSDNEFDAQKKQAVQVWSGIL